ncbi:methyl-accepting chemotaxis protein [Aquincola tertiaricarbonis]|uniref:methyl-accepting chemotaxis protein n=1 Tax=Aquincola tertiaricarbonis TaxID=391953 RepID=UPI000696BF26|nr:methyl-accepting chemotaxis protein [Aquincola tertiaricarbonis]
MKNLSLAQRLGAGFGAVLLMLALVAVLGISRMSAIQEELRQIVEINNVQSRLAVTMRVSINQVSAAARNVVLQTDDAGMKAEVDRVQTSRANYNKAYEQLDGMFKTGATSTAEEKALLAKVKELQDTTRPLVDKAIALGLENKNAEATVVLMKEVQGPMNQWLQTLGQLSELEDKINQEASAEAYKDYTSGRLLMIACSLMALLLGAGAAVMLTRGIVRQIGGEPQYAADVVSRIANGDLSVQVAVRDGDSTSLLAAMRNMQQSLVRVVDGIRAGSDSIATGSAQIATGNADLSQRTEEQASNLQQTAASMEQLNATVKNNAETARQATQLAASASQVASQGGEVVGKVVATMDDITQSSKRIADIISTIDGIAFQTNILALNAAVEAARAGEQGRGFAVVAGEVRSLASRSAEAAKEIKSLIGASVEKVEVGTTLVADAGRTMDDIVIQVRRVSDLISEISAATLEQTQGIGQVNDAVTQLDQVTQQNAALVEESAAAAESLRSQADRLVETVSAFKTGN